MNFEIAPKETEIQSNWYDAKLYCFTLNIDGKTGWRLPTKEELNEIYQSENDFVGGFYWSSTEGNGTNAWFQRLPTKEELNEIYQSENDFVGSNYWSSTENGGVNAWVQDFDDGSQYSYGNKDNGSGYVRAIISIP